MTTFPTSYHGMQARYLTDDEGKLWYGYPTQDVSFALEYRNDLNKTRDHKARVIEEKSKLNPTIYRVWYILRP